MPLNSVVLFVLKQYKALCDPASPVHQRKAEFERNKWTFDGIKEIVQQLDSKKPLGLKERKLWVEFIKRLQKHDEKGYILSPFQNAWHNLTTLDELRKELSEAEAASAKAFPADKEKAVKLAKRLKEEFDKSCASLDVQKKTILDLLSKIQVEFKNI